MYFLYNTILGRLILKILLHTKILKLAEKYVCSSFSKPLVKYFIKNQKIDMSDFAGKEYKTFADFFSRQKDEINFDKNPSALISPCDGLLSVFEVEENSQFKIKGVWYSVFDLIKDEKIAHDFNGGLCLVFRLQATDYHHFCYFDDCHHGESHFIPGLLHSVQPIAIYKEPVFRMNRRKWSLLYTENFGVAVQIEVGAVLVGGIVHRKKNKKAARGEDMGHFELCGSTIIILLKKEIKEQLQLLDEVEDVVSLFEECPVKMGMAIGHKM